MNQVAFLHRASGAVRNRIRRFQMTTVERLWDDLDASLAGSTGDAPRSSTRRRFGRRALMQAVGYSDIDIDSLSDISIERFEGAANLFDHVPVLPGDAVLDLGNGAAIDTLIAGDRVGAEGIVIAVESSRDRAAKCDDHARGIGASNVRHLEGDLAALPFANSTFDCVLANCTVGGSSSPVGVLGEVARVLKPFGHFGMTEMIGSDDCCESIARYVGWLQVAGLHVVRAYESSPIDAASGGVAIGDRLKHVTIVAMCP